MRKQWKQWQTLFSVSQSVQLLNHVRMFATPWTTTRQASLSITNSRSPPKPMSIESVMSSNHLILCCPLLLLPSIFPSIGVFSNESALPSRWPKYWSFSFNISPSNEHPGLISFRMDWLDLLAVQGTFKSLLQHYSSKASILQWSAFCIVQLSHLLGGSKITASGDFSPEIKRRLLLGRKVMTNLDSILKSRDIPLSTKVHLVKAMVFPVIMYGCESWTIKKTEHQRTDAFELCCWRRLLRVLWTARRSNQAILKEISPEYSLEELILKLKVQYFSHLMWRADSFEKTLMLKKIECGRRRGDRRWDGWMASPTQSTWVWVNSGSWWWTGRPGMLQSMRSQRVGQDWVTELYWTELCFSFSLVKE